MATFSTATEGAAVIAQRCDQARETPTGWQACCPAHEDRSPSLSITPTDDRILLHCHAGCAVEAIVAALGLTLADLFVGPPSRRPPARRPSAPPPPAGPPQITATYDYDEAQGTLSYQVVRWEPGRHGERKSFTQRRPHPTRPGAWIDNLQGVGKVLYNLPAVLQAVAVGEPIYLPEGEKDAHNLIDQGLTATTNAGGAAKWEPQYTETLRGAHIVILQDNDAPGRRHTARLLKELVDSAASLRVAEFPELPPKGDVSDWLEAGGTRAQLEARVAATPLWEPRAETAAAAGPPPPETRLVASPVDAEYPSSDAYNAWQLIHAHGAQLRYCAPVGGWLTWTGTHWQRDTTGLVLRWQRQTVKALGAALPTLGDTAAKALLAHIKASLNTARLKAAVEQAQTWAGISIDPAALDADPWLLNCQNGTLDLRVGDLRPHQPADLLTKCLPVAYDAAAPCPTWEGFLWRIMGGSQGEDTPEMRADQGETRHAADNRTRALLAFLQRAVGYTLTGSTREQCLFILHGVTKTGKSTFLATLRALLGPYGQQADMSSFLHKDRDEVRNDLADLAGSRFVCALEAQEGKRLAEHLVKQLTGGSDLVKARFLFQEYFTFKPQFKIFLGTNHKPVIKDTDSAIWERIRLVPFDVQIPVGDRDKTLDERLQHELPGILAWAVRGCLEWQQLGALREPDAVVTATAGYREEMDVLGAFLAECCVVAAYAKIKASALYKAYQDWCTTTGEPALVQRTFGRRLGERGLQHTREGTGYFWHGIGLTARAESSEPSEPSER